MPKNPHIMKELHDKYGKHDWKTTYKGYSMVKYCSCGVIKVGIMGSLPTIAGWNRIKGKVPARYHAAIRQFIRSYKMKKVGIEHYYTMSNLSKEDNTLEIYKDVSGKHYAKSGMVYLALPGYKYIESKKSSMGKLADAIFKGAVEP